VLEALLAAGGAVVSSEELLEKVWDENTDPFSNVVRVTIMTLRKKLGEPPLIETLAGLGTGCEPADPGAQPAQAAGCEVPAMRRRTISLRLRLTLSYGGVFFASAFC